MALQDTDLFVVGRGSDSYKITYDDLKEDIGAGGGTTTTIETPSVLTPPNGAGLGPATPYYPETSAITAAVPTDIQYGDGVTVIEASQYGVFGDVNDPFTDGISSGFGAAEFEIMFNPPLEYNASQGIKYQGKLGFIGVSQTSYAYSLDNGTTWYSIGPAGPDPDWNYVNDGTDFDYALQGSDNVIKMTPKSDGTVSKIIFRLTTAPTLSEIDTTGKFNSEPAVDTSNRIFLKALFVNDERVLNGTSVALTLTDDKAYNAAGEEQDTLVNAFEVGDTVTAEGGGINGSQYQGGTVQTSGSLNTIGGTSWDNIFNGKNEDSSDRLVLNISQNATGWQEYTLPKALNFDQTIEMEIAIGDSWSGTGNLIISLKAEDGSVVAQNVYDSPGGTDFTTQVFTRIPEQAGKSIKSIYVYANPKSSAGSPVFGTISVDGSLITTDLTTGTVSAVSGNTMTLSTDDDWSTATKAINDVEKTTSAPGADDIVFTSSIPAVSSGTVTTWGNAEWQLATNNLYTEGLQSATVPITVDDAIQQVPDGTFTLEGDTQYWVRVRYTADTPSTASSYSLSSHTFKTAAGDSGNIDVALGGLTTTYTGNGGTQKIQNEIDLANGGGMVWIKYRNFAVHHRIVDSERGPDYFLESNVATAQLELPDAIQFNSDGFTLKNDDAINGDGGNYVAWTFAKAAGFFDVVQWDGDGVNPRQIPHNLGTTPGMIIVKRTDNTGNWVVHHKELGNDSILYLQTNGAKFASPLFNNTDPTDTHFTVTAGGDVNGINGKYVAYLFADTPGTIKCGSYTGTGGAQTIDCGFGTNSAQWVLVKTADKAGENWGIYDVQRGMTTGTGPALYANLSNAEQAAAANGGPVAVPTGFSVDGGWGNTNNSGTNYVYVAIAAPTTNYFYDESLNTAVVGAHITQRYGLDPETNDMRHLGIYPLDQQPNFAVDAFVKEGDRYRVVRDRNFEINRLTSSLEDARSRLASLESDEVNDDATDTALLTLLANLTQRVTDLEQSN